MTSRMTKVTGTLFAVLTMWVAALNPAAVAVSGAAEQLLERETWSAATAPPAAETPRFPGLPVGAEVLRLENGLQVLFLRNPGQPMASVTTQVLVGSAHEDFRTSGMSHMLEHLLFNGSDGYTQEQQYELADRIGAWNNAHTTDFYTNFIMIVPAENLETGIELQAEMLFHSLLPPDKFEKERGIVVGEIVQGRDWAGDFADDALREALYGGSSLGMPTLGTLSTIEHLRRDDVYDFYKHHYVPNNMITTVAGNFDRDAALALLQEHYGEVPPGTVSRPELGPARYLDRTHAITRRGGDVHVLALAYEAPAYGSPDFFPFLVLTSLLDAPVDGILSRAMDGLPPDERAEIGSWWERNDGFGRLVIELRMPADADPARYHGLVSEALARAVDWGVTPDDVHEVVRMQETETLIEREQLRHLAIMSSESIANGGVDFFLNFLGDLGAVEAEEVTRVLGAYLVGSPHLAVHVLPGAAADAPDGAQAEVVLKRSELTNGAVLVTLQNPASALFAAHLTVRNRAEIDGDRPGALNMVHRLLPRGIGGCDAACVSHKLRSLGAEVKLVDDPRFPMDDYYTTGRFSFIRLETAAANGVESLVLLLDMIQHASFTAEAYAEELAAQAELLGRGAHSARGRADRILAEALYGDHPLANPPAGDPGSLESLTYDILRHVYHKAFAPSNLVFAVASPLAHAQLAALIQEQLPGRGTPNPGLPPA
ncbi:insulinase family protein, partial [bacterium]|nr:insulinase family protein [bacterium]